MIEDKTAFQIVVLIVVTFLNFSWWFSVGRHGVSKFRCSESSNSVAKLPSNSARSPSSALNQATYMPLIEVPPSESFPFRMDLVLSSELLKYRDNALSNIRYPTWSLLLDKYSYCDRLVHIQTSSKRKFSCLALSHAALNASYNLLRYEDFTPPRMLLLEQEALRKKNEDTLAKNRKKSGREEGEDAAQGDDKDKDKEDKEDKEDKDQKKRRPDQPLNSTGFFDNVANDKGRLLLARRMSLFLRHYESLAAQLRAALQQRQLPPGSSVIAMVMNDGELELFFNMMCSLRKHALVSLARRMVVFTSTPALLPLLRAFGCIAIFHADAFPRVSAHSSFEYLDPIFIEMMWFKSFSVYALLSLGYDVLFQDVDIVYFRDPFLHFQQVQQQRSQRGLRPVDAFLSDDGQRSLRYAPFYANSGYYFLLRSEKTVYFAYSVLISFDLLHITGSHQNIFTLRLLEALDLYYLDTHFLPMKLFPSGVKFSHDRPYMRAIQDHHEHPFMFHMCWTKNKEHKLRNFREAKMWYVAEEATQFALQFEAQSHEAQRRQREGEGEAGGGGGGEDGGGLADSVYMRRAAEALRRGDWDDERRAREIGDLVCLDTDNVA